MAKPVEFPHGRIGLWPLEESDFASVGHAEGDVVRVGRTATDEVYVSVEDHFERTVTVVLSLEDAEALRDALTAVAPAAAG